MVGTREVKLYHLSRNVLYIYDTSVIINELAETSSYKKHGWFYQDCNKLTNNAWRDSGDAVAHRCAYVLFIISFPAVCYLLYVDYYENDLIAKQAHLSAKRMEYINMQSYIRNETKEAMKLFIGLEKY